MSNKLEIRSVEEVELRDLTYRNCRIKAHKTKWEVKDEAKGIWKKRSSIQCLLFSKNLKYSPLNLGECNDGSKFTSVNQAVNQAKVIVDYFSKPDSDE